MRDILLEEIMLCLKTFHKNVVEDEGVDYSLEFILSLLEPLEISAMLFGWLSAKGLWNKAIVTHKLFNLAKAELLK